MKGIWNVDKMCFFFWIKFKMQSIHHDALTDDVYIDDGLYVQSILYTQNTTNLFAFWRVADCIFSNTQTQEQKTEKKYRKNNSFTKNHTVKWSCHKVTDELKSTLTTSNSFNWTDRKFWKFSTNFFFFCA